MKVESFPALRGLARLADLRPVIVIDSREQAPLPISHFPAVRGSLQTGDYSFAGGEESFAIERKAVPDLVACCMGTNRERFSRSFTDSAASPSSGFWLLENGGHRSRAVPESDHAQGCHGDYRGD